MILSPVLFYNGGYEMDPSMIINVISSVGFPIFACCVMFTQTNKLQDTLKEISFTMQKKADEISDIDKRAHTDDKGN